MAAVLALPVGMVFLPSCTENISLPSVSAPGENTTDAAPQNRPRPPVNEPDAGSLPDVPVSDANSVPPPPACREFTIRGVDQLNPEVVLVLDRTASMFAPQESQPGTLMESTQKILRELLITYFRPIYFGYVDFPGRICSADTCCAAKIIPPTRQIRSLVEQSWRCDTSSSSGSGVCQKSSESAPASAALWQAWDVFRRHDAEASRHVFLITDGEPTCMVQNVDECQETRKAVAALGQLDVRTTVLGLGENLRSSQCLDSVAVLGGAASVAPMAAHIVAVDADGLRAALSFAIDQIAKEACTFRLPYSLDSDEWLGVWLEDVPVPEDTGKANGWAFEPGSRSTFTVHGPWCNKLRTSQVSDFDFYRCEN